MTKILKFLSHWFLNLTNPMPEQHALELIRAMRERQFELMLHEQRIEIERIRANNRYWQ